ncbi:MAG: aspartate/glutamate racemase family protein [Spirochaetia bacterium]|nr:aspartate/glutamate racemase family protein [Spirochaetia bacterium]MCF7941816.1 aspartate/glutamate racemase family protein [Spirochaetia bacterium]
MEKKKVGVIHTFLYSVEDLKKLFAELVPEVEMINIIDDSLLREVLANGGVTPAVVRRITEYAIELERLGCDMILNQCSSVGEAADIAGKAISIPYVKVDAPMAREAISKGNRIGVVGTAYTTLGPSVRLVERTAQELGSDAVVNSCYAEGAYDALLNEGNKAKHDKILMETIDKACAENDVVCLAQGSMLSLVSVCADKPVPVLHSFRSGVAQIREILALS